MEAIEKDIERFLAVSDGTGSGTGYSSCYDSCDGFGYDDGTGDGFGGSSGYGSCYGTGDGTGFGTVSGFGYGSGTGVKEYNGHKVYDIDNLPTLIYAVRGDAATGAVLYKDLTLKDCWIAKRGNFFAHGDTLHEAVEDVEAKWMETKPLDVRIAEFVKTHPDLDGVYHDLFDWHHLLTGSCEFGRRRWCEEHGYKPTDSITLRTFFEQTKGDYGGDVIRKVANSYGMEL